MAILNTFPLDNTDYSAADVGQYLMTRSHGVFSADDNLAVVVASGMQITLKKGICWLKWGDMWGASSVLQADETLTVPTAHASLNRIDSVVIRADKEENRAVSMILQGTPAASPVAPVPVRDDYYFDIVLAHVHVPAGLTSLSVGLVTDKRLDEAVCGIMRDSVTGIPTAQLQAQAQALIDNLQGQSFVPQSRKINNKALSSDITLVAGDVGAAAAAHNHNASEINSGTLGVSQGGSGRATLTSGSFLRGNGTGAVTLSTPAESRNAMGLGNTTGALGVPYGGTGLTSVPFDCVLVGRDTGAMVALTWANVKQYFGFMDNNPPSVELFPGSTAAGHGGFIDFHLNNSSADYTSRIIEYPSGLMAIHAGAPARYLVVGSAVQRIRLQMMGGYLEVVDDVTGTGKRLNWD